MSKSASEFVIQSQLSPCRLGSTVNIVGIYDNGVNGVRATITTFAPTLLVDTIPVFNNDSIFVANQTNTVENGIYVVSGVGVQVVLTRRGDFQVASQMIPGFNFFITDSPYSGLLICVVEPQVRTVGIDTLVVKNVPSVIPPIPPTTLNLVNSGLNIYNPAHTFLNHIVPTSAITADRQHNLVTGDQNTNLDFSASPNFAPTAFGTNIVQSTSVGTAQASVGIKSGTTAPNAGGSPTIAFSTPGVLSTDIISVTQLSGTNPVSIEVAVPTANTITVTFTNSPGANTVINWIAIATV